MQLRCRYKYDTITGCKPTHHASGAYIYFPLWSQLPTIRAIQRPRRCVAAPSVSSPAGHGPLCPGPSPVAAWSHPISTAAHVTCSGCVDAASMVGAGRATFPPCSGVPSLLLASPTQASPMHPAALFSLVHMRALTSISAPAHTRNIFVRKNLKVVDQNIRLMD